MSDLKKGVLIGVAGTLATLWLISFLFHLLTVWLGVSCDVAWLEGEICSNVTLLPLPE